MAIGFKSTKKAEAKADTKNTATTNAAMNAASSDVAGASKAFSFGSLSVIPATVRLSALLGVLSGSAQKSEINIVKTLINFLKGLWKKITSGNKKDIDDDILLEGGLSKEEVLQLINETFECESDLKTIAKDTDLMNKIMTTLTGVSLYSALDALYPEVTDLDVMMDMIYYRFGVPVVSDDPKYDNRIESQSAKKEIADRRNGVDPDKKPPIAWSVGGLQEVYKVYRLLPAKDLNLITCLLHCGDDSVSGAAYGTSTGTTGIYYVNYNASKIGEKEKYSRTGSDALAGKYTTAVGHIDRKDDKRNGVIMMDMTTAHELGHVVDGNAGWKYSKNGSSLRKLDKWEETENSASDVIKGMQDSISGDIYDGKLSADEQKYAVEVAKKYLARKQDNYAGKWAKAQVAIQSDFDEVVKGSSLSDADKETLYDTLVDEACDTNLLYHLWRGQAANSAWYNMSDAMRGLKRPFHQGYDGRPWYTFSLDNWSNKISCYQFRDPKEVFAETYASYHTAPTMGKKKGENTPDYLLAWFKQEGLADVEPESVSGSSEMKEDKSE